MRRQRQKEAIQTGRTLPPRYKTYTPGELPASSVEAKPPRRKIFSFLIWSVLIIFIVCLAAAITLAVWDARNISGASRKLFGSGSITSLLSGGDLQTDSNGRVNVLVAGYSADDPGHAGAKLTDSIMVISMNPDSKTGYMLSIPRDLYVAIPGNGYGKINEAYQDGGMPLLTQVAQKITGYQIPYYALVNYAAVRGIVDAVGGIDVTINSPDGRLYDPNKDYTTGGPLVDLSNGTHHLNGQQALDLSRARGDTDPLPYYSPQPIGFAQSDFQRAADQHLIFSAIKAKLNWKLILNPRKNSQILNAIADNVKTNIQVSEARPLFSLFNDIPNEKLKSLSMRDLNGHNYLASTYYEGSTLTPAAGLDDYSQIQSSLSQIAQQ
jgi:LCP family protein required for cell wall assembly